MAWQRGELDLLGLDGVAARLLGAAPLEPVIRSVLFGSQRFAEHGRSLAAAQSAARPGQRRGASFFPRLHDNVRMLHDARMLLEQHAQLGHHLAPAAGWLIDNASLVERQLETVRQNLPRRYYAKLPTLRDEPLAGLPRVYGLVWAWVAHTDSGLDEELLRGFVSAYQAERELTLAELWAIPTTIRVVLIENLRRLAERAATLQVARDAAHRWVERAIDDTTGTLLAEIGARLTRRGALEAFALQIQRRLDDVPADRAAAARAWLAEHLPDAADALQRQHQQAAEDHLSVRNAVTSLRGIDSVAWREVLLRDSAAFGALLDLPVFAAEADATQDVTLHDIERLARRADVAESRVSAALVRLTQGIGVDDARSAPLYWLRGEGRGALLADLGLPDRWAVLRRTAARAVAPAYGAVLVAATLGLLAALLHEAPADRPGWVLALTVLLAAVPASEAVIAVLHRLICESMPPRNLPRLSWDDGIPAERRVLVVMPVILRSPVAASEAARQLEQHHLANPETHAQFALLSDFADAPTQRHEGDDAVLEAARAQLEALNRGHPTLPGAPPRFLLLHRARVWSDSEQCWMGWERKRGKLEQLVAWLAEAGPSPFLDLGPLSTPAPGVRSVVTLDADTVMPPGRLRELAALAAHPLNRPVVDAAQRRVVAGWAILQPRLVVPLPQTGSVTAFHWLFSGQTGIDPYSIASSEVYQDLFDEGSFTGKGLLDVAAVHATLSRRLPGSQVLSHDLLEGSFARCATVTDVTLVEDAPGHPDVAASRQHRWTRGDWQLLPFILHPGRWPMAAINRWKMVDNLRRSLVAPASLALLAWVMASGALPLGATLALVAAAFGAGPVLGALAALAPPRDDIALRAFFARTGLELVRASAGTVWHLVQLPAQALLAVDAIARALWRQFASRRCMLEWTTAAAAQAAARHDLASIVRRQRRVTLAALALLVLVLGGRALAGGADTLAADLPAAGGVAALCLLWAAAPIASWAACQRRRGPSRRLDEASRERLLQLARDTWTFYAQHVDEANHHVPPDNVQLGGDTPMVARRTSPTNIGLYLLSAAVARELGFIDSAEMVRRIEHTFATLDRLPRWHGHFYNWIDTERLGILHPAYVSTVDSGNFSGHLLVLASACEIRAGSEHEAPTLRHRFQGLAGDARALALAADFCVLYDRRRQLLHIGHDVDADKVDPGHYDLLASEARLASLVAIAKGDVPPQHWATLGRPLFGGAHGLGWRIGLKSWSGSMFEYLMPSLVLHEPEGSLLGQAIETAVAAQRADGDERGRPWGVSESAMAVQDHTLAYQYGPHGVARLALRRTPADEQVIAPYATAMALLVEPQAAADNLARLEALGARRELGFVESLDYTPRRQPSERPGGFTLVETFMAHHQAMCLLACAHVLTDGVVQRWAAREPHLRAVMPLLHERVPHVAPLDREQPAAPPQVSPLTQPWQHECPPRQTPVPPTLLLGNDRYALALRADGTGFSQWQGIGLTRWRDDALRGEHGLFGYLRRSTDRRWVSLGSHPAPDGTADYRAEFYPDRAHLHADWRDLQTTTTVSVSPSDDCELRSIVLHNAGRRPLRLELALAFEPTLAPQSADEAHPAFSNLFVSARWSAADRALWLERRPRLAQEPAPRAVFALTECDDPLARVRPVADRERWLGRLGSAAAPLPIAPGGEETADAAGEVELDTGLDPVAAIIVSLTVPRNGSRTLGFVLAAAAEVDSLRALIDRYEQPSGARRALRLSATLSRIGLRALRLDPDAWSAWLQLSALLVARHARGLPPPQGPIDRRRLWRFGLSGERPMVAVWIESPDGLDLVRQLVAMLALWTAGGLPVDLVIVNAEPASYPAPVQQGFIGLTELAAQVSDHRRPPERRAALTLLDAHDLQPDEAATLRLLARVTLQADGRSLAQHIDRLLAAHKKDHDERRRRPRLPIAVLPPQPAAATPAGRFDPDDASYRFEVSATRHPLRPWINVLANPRFGCQVSESAAGFCWAGNSRMHQITAASNDALCDPPSEGLWLHDQDSGRVHWLGRGVATAREVVHGIGFTRMHQIIDGLSVVLDWCVDPEAAVRQVAVHIAAQPDRPRAPRRLRLVAYADWTLGSARVDRAGILTQAAGRAHEAGFALLATQCDGGGASGATAFLAWRPGAECETNEGDWTTDRRELFDIDGRWVLPQRLGMRAGAGLDACAALACRLAPRPGRPASAALLLGHADSPEAAERLARQSAAVEPARRRSAQLAVWPALFDTIEVRTPDPAFDALVNRWLPYQAVACRLWARAGFYQAGGAYGFRDQLQDAMNLVDRAPGLLAEQLVRHAGRQFPEGDVQHWWHEPGGAGVRTHMSDDLLWLPLALAHGLAHGLCAELADRAVPFLDGRAVPPGEEDLYETPAVSSLSATLYEHAARAIDRSLETGVHGLPLMGTGDWNDGMNRVGNQGRGESVWLAWFLVRVIDDFAPLAERRGESERAARWRTARAALMQAIERDGWDGPGGRWYRRAYFDDGSPLGSAANAECRIDLIAQAWSVLSGAGDGGRSAIAMDSVRERLWDPRLRLLRLLDPPLVHAQPNAGYIQAYPPGIRENGGQYNHAAVWALMAFAAQHDPAWAWRTFESMSPPHRSAEPRLGAAYRIEPYVLAGDIYAHGPGAGHGGWSWYTGAASWLQRAALESLCGLHFSAVRAPPSPERRLLTLVPCLPSHWDHVEIMLRHDGQCRRLTLSRGGSDHRGPDARSIRLRHGDTVDLGSLADKAHLFLRLT